MNDISKAVSSDWRRHFEGISSRWDDYYKGSDYDSYAKQERARYAVDFVKNTFPAEKGSWMWAAVPDKSHACWRTRL